jgi:peptidoglycan/LPS O-acetylase OafA/YrhL
VARDVNRQTKPNWALLAGIRFLLALIVAMYHLGMVLDGTESYYEAFAPKAAVYLFLVVSGFSIAASFEREPETFYRRRFWRVAPLYFVGCLLGYLPFLILHKWGCIPYSFGLALNAPAPWKVPLQFAFLQPGLVPTIPANGALWSTGVEVCFYALVPFLSRVGSRWLALIALACGLWYALVPQLLITDPDLTIYPRSIWAFLAGWLFYKHREDWRARVLLVTFLGAVYLIHNNGGETYAAPLVVAVGSLIAFSHLLPLSPRASRIAEYLGDLSFPLYVIHWPLAWSANFLNLDIQAITFLLITVSLAVPCLHFIDRPLRALGRRSSPTPEVEALAPAYPGQTVTVPSTGR